MERAGLLLSQSVPIPGYQLCPSWRALAMTMEGAVPNPDMTELGLIGRCRAHVPPDHHRSL